MAVQMEHHGGSDEFILETDRSQSIRLYILWSNSSTCQKEGDCGFQLTQLLHQQQPAIPWEPRRIGDFQRYNCPVYGGATFNMLHLIASQKPIRVSPVRSGMRDTNVLCVSVEVNPDVKHRANYKDAYQAEWASQHLEQNINWEGGGTAEMLAAC